MANDIQAAVSGVVVKNGTSLVSCTRTGEYSTINTYVQNSPTIADIENKYDGRFDDPRYYSGDNASWKLKLDIELVNFGLHLLVLFLVDYILRVY